MTDSPGLIISGSGSIAVSTDAMLADAVRLHTLAMALPSVSMSLRHIAAMAGNAEAAALGSFDDDGSRPEIPEQPDRALQVRGAGQSDSLDLAGEEDVAG